MSKRSAMTDKSSDRIGLSRNVQLIDGHKNFPAKLDWTKVALYNNIMR